MKCFSVVLLCSLLFPKNVSSTSGNYIEKEEYQAWVVFKKNENELYVAKEYRYNNDPIYFAFVPKTQRILDATTAERLWDELDKQYEQYLQNIQPSTE